MICTRLTKHSFADLFAKFTSLPVHKAGGPFPQSLRASTLELASNNLVCSVALTGVLALQSGRWWAERADADDEEVETVQPEITAEAAAEEAKRKRRKERAAASGVSSEKSPKKLQKRRVES